MNKELVTEKRGRGAKGKEEGKGEGEVENEEKKEVEEKEEEEEEGEANTVLSGESPLLLLLPKAAKRCFAGTRLSPSHPLHFN